MKIMASRVIRGKKKVMAATKSMPLLEIYAENLSTRDGEWLDCKDPLEQNIAKLKNLGIVDDQGKYISEAIITDASGALSEIIGDYQDPMSILEAIDEYDLDSIDSYDIKQIENITSTLRFDTISDILNCYENRDYTFIECATPEEFATEWIYDLYGDIDSEIQDALAPMYGEDIASCIRVDFNGIANLLQTAGSFYRSSNGYILFNE